MKCAIITGGSRGIGRAICLKLAEEKNYHLLINYTSNEALANETLEKVKELGTTGEILKFDVSNAEETTNVLTDWQDKNPDAIVEVIINNAGITRDGLFMWMKYEDWNNVINTSLNGFFNVTNFFIQKLLRNKYGRIINMVSVSGAKGTAGQTNYSAAKGGVIGATKALAQEIAKRNITVNAVAPGFIKTDMTHVLPEQVIESVLANTPLRSMGESEDVSNAALFLASDMSKFITGQVIRVDGGLNL